MNKDLHTWLSQFIEFDFVDYKSDLSDIVVDLFISDKCNLRCKHCYFGNTQTIGAPLTFQDWKKVIGSFHSEGVRHFHISGRESSLDNRILKIVSYIKNLEGTYTGIVSNGTGQPQFYKTLINEGLDYLEFSIDGTEDTHNYIRGKNTFSKIISLLESLSLHSNLIDISTCLNKNSFDEYFSLIDFCLDLGIRRFFATPFLTKGHGQFLVNFSINPSVYSLLIKKSFSFLKSKSKQKIILKYCVPHEMTFPLIKNGAFFRQQLINYLTNRSGLIYYLKGNIIQISLDLLDIHFLHNISITSDGEVIPCSDYISDSNYVRYSIGNVQKTNISSIIQTRAERIINNLNSLQK